VFLIFEDDRMPTDTTGSLAQSSERRHCSRQRISWDIKKSTTDNQPLREVMPRAEASAQPFLNLIGVSIDTCLR
jgi:hypothetical protein